MPLTPIPGWTQDSSPFHAGEIQIHERLGIRASIEDRVRRAGIRDYMPEQHRRFFSQLPFLVLASVDREGQPWATLRVGQPGFVTTPDERTVRIAAGPLLHAPLGLLEAGAFVGALGIEPPTRRRNRVNGIVTYADNEKLQLAVSQSYGNCPKYIQSREPRLVSPEVREAPGAQPRVSSALSSADQALIHNADTFFIASSNLDPEAGVARGVDVSHKGGRPGFVRIDDESTLTFPDFTGNSYFNTLGNLLRQPKTGLVFIDFQSGDILYLAGRAHIIWDGPEVASFTGAQRLVRIHVIQAIRVAQSLPMQWTQPVYAPELARTGVWP
jgi:predicted pyridoxine 5'-phosphate oxidase superfamily flavin-nucleotide-binding protein